MQVWNKTNNGSTTPHAIAIERARGFSLVEIVFVIAIVLVLSRITFLFIFHAKRNAEVQTGLQTVLERTRLARQLAIDKRIVHVITYCFTPAGCTVASTDPVGGGPTVLNIPQDSILIQSRSTSVIAPCTVSPCYTVVNQISLPTGVSFTNVTGIPTSPAFTPDGFGQGGQPMQFDCGAGGSCGATPTNFIWFYPDGTGQDDSLKFNNAVIYIARPGQLLTSRSVTVWGATGKIKTWMLAMNGGVSTWQ